MQRRSVKLVLFIHVDLWVPQQGTHRARIPLEGSHGKCTGGCNTRAEPNVVGLFDEQWTYGKDKRRQNDDDCQRPEPVLKPSFHRCSIRIRSVIHACLLIASHASQGELSELGSMRICTARSRSRSTANPQALQPAKNTAVNSMIANRERRLNCKSRCVSCFRNVFCRSIVFLISLLAFISGSLSGALLDEFVVQVPEAGDDVGMLLQHVALFGRVAV